MDTVLTENFESYEALVKISMRDKRMVLTKGARNFAAARQMVEKGHCMLMSSDKTEEQVKCKFVQPNLKSDPRQSTFLRPKI